MIRNGQSHCESPDKAKGQSVVEEDDDDEEGPPGPTMTSTPIKSAESATGASSNGQGSREGQQQAALSGDKSNSTTGSSRRAVPGKSASGGYSIQDGSMEVDVSTPTEMYKVSAYCVTWTFAVLLHTISIENQKKLMGIFLHPLVWYYFIQKKKSCILHLKMWHMQVSAGHKCDVVIFVKEKWIFQL